MRSWQQLRTWKLLSFRNQRFLYVDTYCESAWFEFRPEHPLSWLIFPLFFSVPPGKCRNSASMRLRTLPSKSFKIQHYSIILPSDALIQESKLKIPWGVIKQRTDDPCCHRRPQNLPNMYRRLAISSASEEHTTTLGLLINDLIFNKSSTRSA
jgi:hypothetical protein